MYCTRACTTDADCASGPRSLTCLTGCAEYPELAGFCWSPDDAAFLAREACPAAAPAPDAGPTGAADGGPTGAPDAAPSPPDAGGGAPMPDAGAGGPAIKFCNRLRRSGAAVELTLEIGGQVRLQATSDACAPPLQQACPAIPAGEAAVRLLEGAAVLAEATVIFEAGQEYFATAEVDPADNMVFFSTDAFEAGASCALTDPLTLPHPRKSAKRSGKSTRWSPGP